MRSRIHFVLAIAAASLLASAAAAKQIGSSLPPAPATLATCGPNDVTAPTAVMITCNGYISGNLLNGKAANILTDQNILNAFPYASGWDGKIADVKASTTKLTNGLLDFGITLKGVSILAIHYGAAKGAGGPGGESTAFYVLDAAQGINQFHLKYAAGFSNASLFVTGLPRHIAATPEPATWATMIAGFGMIGMQMRRRRKVAATA